MRQLQLMYQVVDQTMPNEQTEYEAENLTELEALKERQIALQALFKTKGYNYLMETLQQNHSMKVAELCSPPNVIMSEDARTFVAGEVSSLTFLLNFASNQISAIQSQIDALENANREDEQEVDAMGYQIT